MQTDLLLVESDPQTILDRIGQAAPLAIGPDDYTKI
jgi:hypothetical protein